jgi:hypothetical protein
MSARASFEPRCSGRCARSAHRSSPGRRGRRRRSPRRPAPGPLPRWCRGRARVARSRAEVRRSPGRSRRPGSGPEPTSADRGVGRWSPSPPRRGTAAAGAPVVGPGRAARFPGRPGWGRAAIGGDGDGERGRRRRPVGRGLRTGGASAAPPGAWWGRPPRWPAGGPARSARPRRAGHLRPGPCPTGLRPTGLCPHLRSRTGRRRPNRPGPRLPSGSRRRAAPPAPGCPCHPPRRPPGRPGVPGGRR